MQTITPTSRADRRSHKRYTVQLARVCSAGALMHRRCGKVAATAGTRSARAHRTHQEENSMCNLLGATHALQDELA